MTFSKIQNMLDRIVEDGIMIDDYERLLGYLHSVGYHRLAVYKRHAQRSSDRMIGLYLFDKKLRLLLLDMLEVFENSLKATTICITGSQRDHSDWYTDATLYEEEYRQQRLGYIRDKLDDLQQKDQLVASVMYEQGLVPDELFFDKLTFGETTKIISDLQITHRKSIANAYGLNYKVLDNRLKTCTYLRNLCSHYEPIYGRTMVYTIKGKGIIDVVGNNKSFAAYFLILSVIQKILMPQYNWNEKVISKMNTFGISGQDISLDNKNLPSKLGSEAWEVLVDEVYRKNVKNANLF